jgi:phage terminase small subunit
MPALKNQKHEAFAQAVALGMPASQAYVEFVSGGKCSHETAKTEGKGLARQDHISARITELKAKVSESAEKKFNLTKEKWLDRLEGIAGKAEKEGDFSAATGALREVGKASAWYAPEEVKHSGSVEIPGLSEAIAATFGRK